MVSLAPEKAVPLLIHRQVNIPKVRRTYCRGKVGKAFHDSIFNTKRSLGMQKPSTAQGHSVQGWEGAFETTAAKDTSDLGNPGVTRCSGEEEIRSKASRLWRPNEASLPQEGKDHQEGCSTSRMRKVQDKSVAASQEMQTL